MSENHLSDLRFDALPMDERIRAGIRDAGFDLPDLDVSAAREGTTLTVGR